MKRILILEDDVVQRQYIVTQIEFIIDDQLCIYECASIQEAKKYIKFLNNSETIDVFLIDIELNDGNGMDFAKKIRQQPIHQFTPMVFITGKIELELDAYRDVHSYAFLRKPYTQTELKNTLQEVLIDYTKYIKKKYVDDATLVLTMYQHKTKVLMKEIVYIERRARKIYVCTIEEELKHKHGSIKELINELDERFTQIHQSIVVNKDYINIIDRSNNRVALRYQGKLLELPIGKKFKREVVDLL